MDFFSPLFSKWNRGLNQLWYREALQNLNFSWNSWYQSFICSFRPVIGTIPSIPIPIPFANFGIELTPNSNSSLGIGATTPTPIQRNWGDSKGFQCLFWNQLKKLKKHVNQVSLVVFLNYQWHLDGEREIQTCGIPWNPPNSVELELELTPQFHLWSWNWGIPKINSKESELECGIVNWPQFFSNDCPADAKTPDSSAQEMQRISQWFSRVPNECP